MKDVKLVSVVVTYNGAHWIKSCLDSLIVSDLPTQIIVVDNKSMDSTREIIKSSYPNVKLVESEVNLGFGKANNIGLRIALDLNADFVFLLNQDARVERDTLEKLVKSQLSNNKFGIVSPVHFTEDGRLLDKNFSQSLMSPYFGTFELISQSILGNKLKDIYTVKFVNAAAWLVTRKCLENIGGFDPLYWHYGEDNNYLDRVRYHNFKIGIVPSAIAYHDRKNRSPSSWKNPFHDELDVFKRNLLINILNINTPLNLKDIKKQLRLELFKSFFYLRVNNIKFQFKLYKFYLSKIKVIEKHLELSKQKGRTYLN